MKSQWTRSALFSRKGGELSLSGAAVGQLLHAVLDKGVAFRFRVKGLSMHPFMRDEDVVTVFPLSHGCPSFGDVVAFVQPETGKLALHRVIGKRGTYCLIKGDNIGEPDGFLPKEAIMGWVTLVEREGKRVALCCGPEKSVIAFLSRTGLLTHLFFPLWRFFRPLVRRTAIE